MNWQTNEKGRGTRRAAVTLWQILWPPLAFLGAQAVLRSLFSRLVPCPGGAASVLLAPVLVWLLGTRQQQDRRRWAWALALTLLGAGAFCALSGPGLLGTAGSCLAGPINEEIVYRGAVYPRCRGAFGVKAAVFISALLFAVAHASLTALLPALLAGCLFAALYERTDTLLLPILLHILWNLLWTG